MGLATQIFDFFNISNARKEKHGVFPRSIADFVRETKSNANQVKLICEKLKTEGLLFLAGMDANDPYLGDAFYNYGNDEKLKVYGGIEFLVGGFIAVRNHFINSVRSIEVKLANDDLRIGTCFIVADDKIITALHCIERMNLIKINDLKGNAIEIKEIWTIKDRDIAILHTAQPYFKTIPHFEVQPSFILDEVLTMGYPPIPGFQAIQIADVARINSNVKSSTGNIVGQDFAYLTKQDLILINARVKGGNSGGPVINKFGYVVGMLIDIPSDPQNQEELDKLGYGVAIPGVELLSIFKKYNGGHKDLIQLPFENVSGGFKTNV